MYALLGIDTVVRITAAMLFLFVAVPALAWPRPRRFSRLEWFWWNLGVGITVLTLAGQLFTFFRIAGPFTYLVLIAAIAIGCRAWRAHMPPQKWIADRYRRTVLFALHVLDGRASLLRRIRRALRRTRSSLTRTYQEKRTGIAVWSIVTIAAAATRLYRPFATANLGFSDTYVHLYLMRLLDQGRQVDPAWGPYPRGMHFLLLAIQRLTNADTILLMNFFGAFAGVLMTLSVAYAARRITRRNAAALLAGLVFATMIGGSRQYFVLGSSISASTAVEAHETMRQPYSELEATGGEFDVLLTAFQRQTSTLPQELAITLLFPAALFLLGWLRTRDRLRLIGFAGCTSAIAAIHSGVVIPLVLLCAAAAIADLATGNRQPATLFKATLTGAGAVALGSTWMLGFLFYRRVVNADSHVGSTALYYFPFLRSFSGGGGEEQIAYMTVTPFLIAILVIALILGIYAARSRNAPALWIAIACGIFALTHAASTLGIPEIVEVRRNVTWLAMSMAVLLGVALTLLHWRAVPAVAIAAWLVTLPNLFGDNMRSRLLDYSGYGMTTYAVLMMSHDFQPFTWTLVSYGQEYPMVLGHGFHLNGADFLDQFDPSEAPLRIPTPYVFIAVEKKPHKFQINNWATRFDRSSIEERLQTWCMLYRLTHTDMHIWLDDDNVRVYEIARSVGQT
ncbi:MAG TPA: hypothetical protein VGR95_14665 [Thermoanaerobaculia bacterium]|jgi:hypothetical protein|nr:hypothetical protein [Thermoanaerobaculia bacterium]